LVGLLELSPQYLVSAAADSTLRIWSPETGQCLATLTGHAAAITCFHHDAKLNRIVSGSEGGVKVWELSSAGYGNSGISALPLSSKGGPGTGPGTVFLQGPNGPQPVYGRYIRDLIKDVQGVWRVRMDEQKLVVAVQREEGRTWFEVLDFGGEHDGVKEVRGIGDGEDGERRPENAEYDMREDDDEDDEDEDHNIGEEDQGGEFSDESEGEQVAGQHWI